MNGMGVLFIAVGIFGLCAACFDWDWFMNGRKARLVVSLVGRTGARVFYGLLGTGFVVAGALVMAGVIVLENH